MYIPERQAGQMGRPREDDRQMLNGILWVIRTGAPLADLPERYGAKSTVYDRFTQWERSGLFAKILKELGVEADLQDMSMDGIIVGIDMHSWIRPSPRSEDSLLQRWRKAL